MLQEQTKPEQETQSEQETRQVSIRYSRLCDVFERSLNGSVVQLTYENLAQCYPSIAQSPKGERALKEIIKQVSLFWTQTAKKEFDDIMTERDVRRKLDSLDHLITKARARQEKKDEPSVHLEKLGPDAILQAHLLPVKRAELDRLSKKTQELERINDSLEAECRNQQLEISTATTDLERIFKGIGEAVRALDDIPSRESILQTIDKTMESLPE